MPIGIRKGCYWGSEYTVLDAKGPGKFVGWNITIRIPGNAVKPGYPGGYPVDENEKFFLDGEKEPSVEFQGLEDSFGFSWAFPETQSIFPLTGYFPYFKGGACLLPFLRVGRHHFPEVAPLNIGFGKMEGTYVKEFSKPENRLQISTTAYWYQTEPHSPWPALPSAADREPAPDDNAVVAEEVRSEEVACFFPSRIAQFCVFLHGGGQLDPLFYPHLFCFAMR